MASTRTFTTPRWLTIVAAILVAAISFLAFLGIYAVLSSLRADRLTVSERIMTALFYSAGTILLSALVFVLAFTVIMPSIISQLTFMRAIELIGPGRAGVFVNLVPVFAPLLAPYGFGQLSDAGGNFGAQQPPSAQHLLGTTVGGFDVLSRVIWGAQTAQAARTLGGAALDELDTARRTPGLQTPIHTRTEPGTPALTLSAQVRQTDYAAWLDEAYPRLFATAPANVQPQPIR